MKKRLFQYIERIQNEEKIDNIEESVFNFFSTNEVNNDNVIKLSENLGIEVSEVNKILYDTLKSFMNAGRFVKSGKSENDFDRTQINMGINVEMEHTTNKMIAKRIALDHLTELSDYYTRLAIMEKEGEEAEGEENG